MQYCSGPGQATISRSIDQIALIVRQSVPIPAKIYAESRKISSMDELEDMFPGLLCLTDASEQQIQRPKRKDMEKSHYSGKAHRHTSKVQYTTTWDELIIHNTRHSPGSRHDVKVYKMKHPTFPVDLQYAGEPSDERYRKRTALRHYGDNGYVGAAKAVKGIDMVLPIKKKPGLDLTPLEKGYNRIHSKIRVRVEHAIRRVKTFRIMGGGGVYRNPLKKYDRANDIVCGLVNQRVLLKRAGIC